VWRPQALAALLDDTAEAVRLADARREPAARFWAHEARAMVLVQAGKIAECDASLAECRAIASRLRQPTLEWLVAYHDSWRALLAGDTAKAERLAVDAFGIARTSAPDEAFAIVSAQLFALRWQQGRLGELAGVAEDVTASRGASYRAGLAIVFIATGRSEKAASLLADAHQAGFDAPARMDDLSTLVLWAEVADRLDAGDVAAALVELLVPLAGQIAFDGAQVGGAVAHTVGALLALRDDRVGAEPFLADAFARHEALAAPFFVARTAATWADVLDRGDRRDRERADRLRGRAAALAHAHGYADIARRVAGPSR
jgi:hypothetical protein